jgi:type I restriction enzyme M protein
LRVPTADISDAIIGHPDFEVFSAGVQALLESWRAAAEPLLSSLSVGSRPKPLIASLSEAIIGDFASALLLDPYDIYQCLLDYWSETLQDDAYLISDLGWLEAAKPRLVAASNGQKSKIEPDFLVGKSKFHSELIPAHLLIARYFAESWAAIEKIEGDAASFESQIEQVSEEEGAEGGSLEDLFDEDGKPTKDQKKTLKARLSETAGDEDATDEDEALERFSSLLADLIDAKVKLKTARVLLDAAVADRYGMLTEDETKSLAIRDKWLARVRGDIDEEVGHMTRELVERLQILATRYDRPLPQLVAEVEALADVTQAHLGRMGATWP